MYLAAEVEVTMIFDYEKYPAIIVKISEIFIRSSKHSSGGSSSSRNGRIVVTVTVLVQFVGVVVVAIVALVEW